MVMFFYLLSRELINKGELYPKEAKMTRENYATLKDFYGTTSHEWRQFHKCNAWISNRIYNSALDIEFSLVKSYNTIVAIIDHSNGNYVRLGKYSRTTSKQNTMIHNELYRYYKDIQY